MSTTDCDRSTVLITTLGNRQRDRKHQHSKRSTARERKIEDPGPIRRKKRQHLSSSDTSLLEPAPKQISPRVSREEHSHKRRREESPLRTRKRRKAEPPESVELPQANIRKETFEKRARHKTREDRYDPNKEKSRNRKEKEVEEAEKQPRKRREKKSDKRKAAKKAGEDLMNNFSSKSIGQDRLTVCISPSLFPTSFNFSL